MNMLDLEGRFLKQEKSDLWKCEGISIEQSDGVMFICPKCFVAKGGRVGAHSMICWWKGISQDISPTGGRWDKEGSGIADLTLISSIQIIGACNAHFFIQKGEIVGLT